MTRQRSIAPTVRPPGIGGPSAPLLPTCRPPALGQKKASSGVHTAPRKRKRDNTLVHEGARVGDNRFELIRPLGDGGMGKVWLARHLGLQRQVALKVLHRRVHAQDDLRRRFEREAVAIGRLRHEGIVDALDFGELSDGRKFLAMEYVEGETLDAIAKRVRRLPWRDALRVGVQVADALACAHEHGVIHRDLKPDNLIVEGGDVASGRTRILDLGLARVENAVGLSGISDHNIAMGTPSYSAPEQLLGQPTDTRADVYGLGAVLYRLITGQPPYSGASFEEVAEKMHRGDLAAPKKVFADPSRPKALDALLMRCLARDPDARPGSAIALGDALRAIETPTVLPWRRYAVGAFLVSIGVGAGVGAAILLGG
ncbi:MAG: serine/threonine-protein kinase [Sandaracinaceae bacterium]|nr:MAG: serine/threonine protein kinase [Sandaracinaceae bacterium]